MEKWEKEKPVLKTWEESPNDIPSAPVPFIGNKSHFASRGYRQARTAILLYWFLSAIG